MIKFLAPRGSVAWGWDLRIIAGVTGGEEERASNLSQPENMLNSNKLGARRFISRMYVCITYP